MLGSTGNYRVLMGVFNHVNTLFLPSPSLFSPFPQVLVLGNKVDLPNSLRERELIERL